jgi:hypothetical protein
LSNLGSIYGITPYTPVLLQSFPFPNEHPKSAIFIVLRRYWNAKKEAINYTLW